MLMDHEYKNKPHGAGDLVLILLYPTIQLRTSSVAARVVLASRLLILNKRALKNFFPVETLFRR